MLSATLPMLINFNTAEFAVAHIEEIEWDPSSFECLVLPKKHKDILRALAESQKVTLGPFVFSPHATTGSMMRNNLYLTFTNTSIPPLWQKMVGCYIVLGQAARLGGAGYDRIVSYVRACANTKVRQGGVSSIKLPGRVDLRDIQQRMRF